MPGSHRMRRSPRSGLNARGSPPSVGNREPLRADLHFPSLNDQPAGVRGDRQKIEGPPLGAMLGSFFAFFRYFSHFFRIFWPS